MVLGQINAEKLNWPSFLCHTQKQIQKLLIENIRPETIKIQNENSKMWDLAHRNILLSISLQARETKEKISK